MFDNTPTVHVRAWWRKGRSIELAALRFRTHHTDEQLAEALAVFDACAAEGERAATARRRFNEQPDLDRKLRVHTSWCGPDRTDAPTAAELEEAIRVYQEQVIEDEWKMSGI